MIRRLCFLLVHLTPALAHAADPYVKIDRKGSGTVIVCPDGQQRILTCAHEIEKVGETVNLKFKEQNWRSGKVVAVDRDRDLCLVEIDGYFSVRPVPIVDIAPESGDAHVVGFGRNVFATRPTKILGRSVVQLEYRRKEMDRDKWRDLLHVEATGRAGDSGGALMVRGQLVGVMIAGAKDGYAVPVEEIHEFLEGWAK